MGVQRKELNDDNPAPKVDPKQPIIKGKTPPPIQGPAAKFYEAKAGYANYFFNRQEKNRLFKAFKGHGDFATTAGDWSFDGDVRLLKARTESKFQVEIKEDAGKPVVSLKIGAFPESLNPLNFQLSMVERRKPQGSGGIMAALYVWRLFLTQGEKGFPTECNHGGMEPFYPPPADGSTLKHWMDARVDTEVVTTQFAVYRTKWFFAKTDQKLLGFELNMEEFGDPCEVFFSDYRNVNGRQLPHRMQVYYNDVHYGTFTIANYKLAAAAN